MSSVNSKTLPKAIQAKALPAKAIQVPVTPGVREKIVKGLKAKEMFTLLAETFQALGDSSRIQIVWVLSHGELAVGDIAELVSMSQPAVSHHLRTLRNLKLVQVRREGTSMYYSLDDEHIENLLEEGIKHVEDFL